jgi:hypothetical protein
MAKSHRKHEKRTVREYVYPLLLVAFAGLSAYEFERNQENLNVRAAATRLYDAWPTDISCQDPGTSWGWALAGYRFLEQYKSDFPDTVVTATQIIGALPLTEPVIPATGDISAYRAWENEVCTADQSMYELVKSVSESQ